MWTNVETRKHVFLYNATRDRFFNLVPLLAPFSLNPLVIRPQAARANIDAYKSERADGRNHI